MTALPQPGKLLTIADYAALATGLFSADDPFSVRLELDALG